MIDQKRCHKDGRSTTGRRSRTARRSGTVLSAAAFGALALSLMSASAQAALHGLQLQPSAPLDRAAVAASLQEQRRNHDLRPVTGEVAPTSPAVAAKLATSGLPGDQQPGCRGGAASPSIGADVPGVYFGPFGSQVDPSLVGPRQLLTSGALDTRAGTITLPLYRGELSDGRSVWYIATDTTDEANARALGLNFSSKLAFADTRRGVRNATLRQDGVLVFDAGVVDFSPERQLVPGDEPRPFPPKVAKPGSRGSQRYTPLVKIRNAGGHIYNMPMVAFGVRGSEISFPNGKVDYSKVHDSVVAIDPQAETVTLRLTPGFSFGRPVLYLRMDASATINAAVEAVTLAPGLRDIDTGNDDSLFSAIERIFLFSNGPRGCANPQRQGLDAAVTDGSSPFNVLGGIPTLANDYSPLWDVNLGEWTSEAISKRYRSRLTDEFQILSFVEFGFVTGPGGRPYGSTGVIVNCPIVFRFL